MSVLFRALNKASGTEAPPAPQVVLQPYALKARKRRWPGFVAVFGAAVVVQVGLVYHFREDVEILVDVAREALGLEAPPVFRPAPVVAEATTPSVAQTALNAAAPAPSAQSATAPDMTAAAPAAPEPTAPDTAAPGPATSTAPVVTAAAPPPGGDAIDQLAARITAQQSASDPAPAGFGIPERAPLPAAKAPSLPPTDVAATMIEAAPQVLGAEAPRTGGIQVSVRNAPATVRQRQDEAYAALARGDVQKAADLYAALSREDPSNRAAMLGHAAALQRLGDAAGARAVYGRILAQDPENRPALTNLITLLAQEQPVAALAELERLRARHPTFAPIAAQIGLVKASLGDLKGAAEALHQAVAFSPGDARILVNYAVTLDKAGRKTEAAKAYRQALDLIGPLTDTPLPRDAILQRLSYLESGRP